MKKKFALNLTAKQVKDVGTIVYDKFDDGLRFIIKRGSASWCAYVGLPKEHPLAGFSYDDLTINAHGDLTFSSEGGKGKWPKGYWWYGWDYCHLGDLITYDFDTLSSKNDKDWTIEEVVKDSWGTLYDFKKLMKLAEQIKAK